MGKNKGREENESVIDLRSIFQELLKTCVNKMEKNKGREENESDIDLRFPRVVENSGKMGKN